MHSLDVLILLTSMANKEVHLDLVGHGSSSRDKRFVANDPLKLNNLIIVINKLNKLV